MFPPTIGYPPPNTRLPSDLIVRFWEDVFGALRTTHRLAPADAVAAIVRFRATVDQKIGDMLYHHEASGVADTIAKGWENDVWSPVDLGRTGTTS